MKKIISIIFILTIIFSSLGFNLDTVYSQNLVIIPDKSEQDTKENNYVDQLNSISNQLDILSSNVLTHIAKSGDQSSLVKDGAFIKSQIRNLRLELSEYHKTESGDIEKNPISLGLLNALNYYSMSLSYLLGALDNSATSDESKYLQQYYTNKSAGDNMLFWVKNQLNK
ncbi:MAG: hypothetical protein ACRC92_10480 [Peptostreptococcaceae bacterium]